jgi:Glyoxalase/Bleomycin resistance protein/Dioxygenase superfamily
MHLDHVAYLVRDTQKTLAAMGVLTPAVLMDRVPLDSQQAFITMVQTTADGPLTELVEPFADNRVMQQRLAREGSDSVLYHMGYRVAAFDAQFRAMRGAGWLPLTQPFEGMVPGCRASHLYHPSFGIVEILEVAP